MAEKRQVPPGNLETAVVLDKNRGGSVQEQKLVLECINEDENTPPTYIFPGAYLFENRGSGWVYSGLYPKGTLMLERRSANLRVSNREYALSLDGHVPETLNIFLSEQSQGRPDSMIVLKLLKIDQGDEMEVIDMSIPNRRGDISK